MVANVYVQRKVISHHPAFRILFLVILETMMILMLLGIYLCSNVLKP